MPGTTPSTNFSRPCSPEESSSTFSYCRSRSRRKLRREKERRTVIPQRSNVPLGPSPSQQAHRILERAMHLWPYSGMGSQCRLPRNHIALRPCNVPHLLSRDTFSNFLCAFLSSSWKHSCSCITGKGCAGPTVLREGPWNRQPLAPPTLHLSKLRFCPRQASPLYSLPAAALT